MIDYDFSTLNDKEFENIAIELISRDKNKYFERFQEGKDGGIDGRFSSINGEEEIIQCKHYLKTGYKGLIRALKKKEGKNKTSEKDKVIKLNPKKYIFATSLTLSPPYKKEIMTMFTPYIKSVNDIYGQENLNDILKNNPDIEERHYKLWISSITVLNRILNNAIKGRSEFLFEDIKERIKLYVVTDNHNNALRKLHESRTIIIAGEPGIGKTTLAEHLALNYIEKDFEFISIANSLNEAEEVFEIDKKQIFYFDDFLGSNYLDALESREASHIMKFISRIKKDKNKRFILTSRTNIFNQAQLSSDIFKGENIESNEYIINVDSLEDIDKAKILYNHIWHSDLGEKYIDELYKEKRYRTIIKHKNFNPRLIAFLTDVIKLKDIEAKDYWGYIQTKLNNPSDIWTTTFDRESNSFVRNLVTLTVLNGNKIDEKELQYAYDKLNEFEKLQNGSHSSMEFQSIIAIVIKYFLNRTITRQKMVEYSLFNPSISDFIINRYKNNEKKLMQSFLSLQNLKSLHVLSGLCRNKYIDNHVYNRIVIKLYEELNINNFNSLIELDYCISLFEIIENDTDFDSMYYDESKKVTFFQDIIKNPKAFTRTDEFLIVLTSLLKNKVLKVENYSWLVLVIENSYTELESLNNIIKFTNNFNIVNTDVIDALNIKIEKCLQDELYARVTGLEMGDLNFETDEDGNLNLDESEINLDGYLDDLKMELEVFNHLNIDELLIKNSIDIEDTRERLINDYCSQDSDYDGKIESSYVDDIDALFER